ncbi:leucine-rich repeat protein, partial [Pseudobutyrivibrio sp.]|uniref:leucine-rich repeat domain-containing protein n=1 Tax=Pseudobutyrivibrio sp. TaxID=2014367 RepID=UPI0038696CDD
MKKNLIAFLLAVVMASSSIGSVPAVAAETAAPEAVAVEEDVADGENAAEEASIEGNTSVDETEVTNEAATDDNGSTESIQDQSTEDESETLDEEQETIEEDDAEESLDQDALSTDETEPQEAELENASENELTAEQIQAFQEKIKIWKHDNQITIVYDSTEDVRLSYHIYSVSDGELLYEGNLHWNEENGLYYEAVDFDAVNEAEHRESDEIDITDISVKAVIEVITEQGDEDFDSNANSFEEVVSDDTGNVSITDVDTETDGKITAKWDCTKDEEIDGYYVIVRRSDGNDSVLVYDTDQLTDNADDGAYTQDADSQITLNIDKESVSEINVAAYRFDDDTGVKYFGNAASRIIAEDEDQSVEEAADSETVPKDAKKGIVASGTVGAALKWTVYDDGRLTISGTWGNNDTDTPWQNYSFNRIIIESGITRIGPSAFWNCSGVTSVTIPNTVKTIEFQAFRGCKNLTGVTIPSSVTEIGSWAFYG